MTKLKSLIEKAVSNGYNGLELDRYGLDDLIDGMIDYPQEWPSVSDILFDKNFALALFGDEKSWMEDSHLTFKAYEIHLMEAVISDDPIDYMYNAVFPE